jgi:pSer/pThr/pTyr-binding forkhead associated (FHA) protein
VAPIVARIVVPIVPQDPGAPHVNPRGHGRGWWAPYPASRAAALDWPATMPLRFRILPPSPSAAGTAPSGEAPTFELASDPAEVRLGRQPASEIELPFPSVSLAHARMFRGASAAEWWLEDLGSTNGTWLDGERLRPRRPVALRAGQRVRVATVEVVFEGWSAEARGDPSTTTIARRMISDLFGPSAGEVAILTVESGPAHPDRVRLEERDRRYVAGRADTCDLVLPSEHVSREHAVFVRRWDGVFVEDLGSRNGLRINDQAGASSGRHRLADGDRIEVGVTILRLTDPEDRYLRQLAGADDAAGPTSAPPSPSPSSSSSSSPPPRSPNARRTTARTTVLRRPSGPVRAAAGDRRPGRALAMMIAAIVLVLAAAGLIALLAKWG